MGQAAERAVLSWKDPLMDHQPAVVVPIEPEDRCAHRVAPGCPTGPTPPGGAGFEGVAA